MNSELLCSLRCPACANRLKLVRKVVGEAAVMCGFGADDRSDVVLAVDEACQNVIRHAYKGEVGDLIVELRRDGASLVVDLIDFAEPVDVATVKPRPLEDVRPGGLGTHLIGAIMDEMTFLAPPPGAGNRLRMTKKIG